MDLKRHYHNRGKLELPTTDNTKLLPRRPRQRHVRLRPDQVDALVAAYEQGSTVNQLAASFDTNRNSVMRHLKIRGVKTRRCIVELPTTKLVELRERWTAGETLVSLAAEIGIHPQTLRRHLQLG